MKFLDEYRDPHVAQEFLREIRRRVTRPWTLMEVCGGQTHALVRHGLDRLLPEQVTLVHGPGCPVCVTPVDMIDRAVDLAGRPGITFCSFGDMLRVPGTHGDLLGAKACGADVRPVYSALDALALAQRNSERQVVFFAVGFETTAPGNALALVLARGRQIRNFSMLVSHVLVPPAVEALLASPRNRVQGFLAAGHVCTVMGYRQYEPLARRFQVPFVVTGFEPLDLLQGIMMCLQQLEEGRFEVQNQYTRAVRAEGNRQAQELIRKVFQVVPRRWRGLGEIPQSGLGIRPEWRDLDALHRFALTETGSEGPSECRAGEVLQGLLRPERCPAFAVRCTPEQPLGAPMVSGEGACSAYYRYRRLEAGT